MSKQVPVWVYSTIKQIKWYKDQLDYINNLPVSRMTPKLLKHRAKCTREMGLLLRELKR